MALPVAMLAIVPACSYLPEMPSLPGLSAIKPYRIDIQQGNFLSADMVAQLKEGMTREQVRFVLGTPLVTDIFHADRWDYVYYRELADGKKDHRRVSVFFEDNKLARFTSDNVPAEPSVAPVGAAAGQPGAAGPNPGAEAKKE
ncbi:MAG: outer membrane protein assembly factor BamE [Betaproteobacteria bacterium]